MMAELAATSSAEATSSAGRTPAVLNLASLLKSLGEGADARDELPGISRDEAMSIQKVSAILSDHAHVKTRLAVAPLRNWH